MTNIGPINDSSNIRTIENILASLLHSLVPTPPILPHGIVSEPSSSSHYKALTPSEAFLHLGWTIAYNNSDWAAVYQDLRKVATMEADGLHSIGEYTRRRQANIAEKLA